MENQPKDDELAALESDALALKESILTDTGGDALTAICKELVRTRRALEAVTDQTHFLMRNAELSSLLLSAGDESLFASQPDEAVIDARFPMAPEDGFSFLEYSPSGQPFRWTGPTEAFSFRIPIDRSSALRGTLELVATVDPINYEKLACFADGTEIALQRARRTSRFTFELPSGSSGTPTQLIFLVTALRVPKDEDSRSADTRKIGVAFSKLTLERA